MAKAEKGKALVPKGPELKLVKPTEKEELLIRLEGFKKDGLTAHEQEVLENKEGYFAKVFVCLAKKFTGVSDEQLLKLAAKDKHLKVLNLMVSQKTGRQLGIELALANVLTGAMILFGITLNAFAATNTVVSVAGWMLFFLGSGGWICGNMGILMESNSLRYFWHRRFLRKLRGKDYFPVKAVKKYLSRGY